MWAWVGGLYPTRWRAENRSHPGQAALNHDYAMALPPYAVAIVSVGVTCATAGFVRPAPR